ncbi:MAG: ATP phosphoribosyltransferase [Myxococcota bacterium]|nr:ATP phosphoribosyltransferase [Myxococcota bacterium]
MTDPEPLKLAIPKGRMFKGLSSLFAEAGCPFTDPGRSYRIQTRLDGISTKLLKPQSIVEMVNAGRRDLGFAGADWVQELDADLVELLDTGLDPVRIVAAAPEQLLVAGRLPSRPLVVASEYARITQLWMSENGIEGRFVRSWGATEVLPPEDADCIVDNTATGSTLQANRLEIVDTLMTSSTRLYANPRVLDDPAARERIEALVLVLQSVLDARRRVMVELNVTQARLEKVLSILPAMRKPTLSQLQGDAGSAVRAAVPKAGLAKLIPSLRRAGATDIVVSRIDQIVA